MMPASVPAVMSGDHSSLPNLDSPPFAFSNGRAWSAEDRPLHSFGKGLTPPVFGQNSPEAWEGTAESAGARVVSAFLVPSPLVRILCTSDDVTVRHGTCGCMY